MSAEETVRLVVFAAGPSIYAVPIADVLEVTEYVPPRAVPTLPREIAGAINYHGDVLAVIAAPALFPDIPEAAPPPEYTIVIAAGGGAARLGLPAQRLLGLAVSSLAAAVGGDWIRGRIALWGSAVAVLDARRLAARAQDLLMRTAAGVDAPSLPRTQASREEPSADGP